MKAWSVDGRRVLYIDKDQRQARLVGMKRIFVAPGLLTIRYEGITSAELEIAFGRVESHALPKVREFVGGGDSELHHRAVKELIALHFARSLTLARAHETLHAEFVGKMLADACEDADLTEAYIREHGRAPSVRDLRDVISSVADASFQSNINFVQTVERFYNKALEYFEPMHIQRAVVAKPSRGDLLMSDSPVVVAAGTKGSVAEPIALLDADLLWFPLSPQFGVTLTTKQEPDVILGETRPGESTKWCGITRLVMSLPADVRIPIALSATRTRRSTCFTCPDAN